MRIREHSDSASKFDGDSLILIPKIDDLGDETVGGRILDFSKSVDAADTHQ